ncbi:MAG: T9SS type A sorting domain-containing protein [Sphingobacteriales bacterium]|nr:MAG: T9SS type A sorting domain-containing protein [Sphingobacteriales bacterium]
MSSNRKGTWLQADNAGGPWEGIHILIDAARLKTLTGIVTTLSDLNNDVKFYENMKPGLKVKVTGILDDFQGYTQLVLLPIESEITELTPNKIKPTILDIATFSKSDGAGSQTVQLATGEPYESIYAEIRNVTVVDVSSSGNGRFFWSIQDDNGNKMQVRDASGYFRNDGNTDSLKNNNFTPPPIGTRLNYIRGIIFQSAVTGVNVYSIAPLMRSDVDIAFLPPVITSVSRTPVMAKSTDVVTVRAIITDDKDSVTAAKLYYSVGVNNKNYTQVNMAKNGATNMFTAQIPAQANGSVVNYFVSATDNDGKTVYSPDSFKTGNRYLVRNEAITKISDLQYDPLRNGNSIWNRDTLANLDIRAVVTAGVGEKDLGILTIQDGTAPFSGIMIKGKTDVASENIKRGDSIRITSAVVREDFNVTILENVKLDILNSNGTIPSAIKGLSVDSLRLGKYNYAEAYESMLIELNDVYVVKNNADSATNGQFGEWVIDENNNDDIGLRVDDQSNDINPEFGKDSVTRGQKLDYIRGIFTYSFSNWKLLPRNKSDIAGFKTQEDEDTTINSIQENKNISFHVYPNPANNAIYIQSQKYFSNAVLQVSDLQGKVFFEQVIYGNSPIGQLNIVNLPNGLYLVKISDKSSVQVDKILVQH